MDSFSCVNLWKSGRPTFLRLPNSSAVTRGPGHRHKTNDFHHEKHEKNRRTFAEFCFCTSNPRAMGAGENPRQSAKQREKTKKGDK